MEAEEPKEYQAKKKNKIENLAKAAEYSLDELCLNRNTLMVRIISDQVESVKDEITRCQGREPYTEDHVLNVSSSSLSLWYGSRNMHCFAAVSVVV